MAKKPTKKEKDISVDDMMKSIRSKYGQESIMILDKAPAMEVKTTPTGSFSLDLALGVGGIPIGRIVEVFGPESSGKTTLALHAVAEAQKLGGLCAYIDTEHALDPEYARKLGVKTDQLIISQPEYGEQALDMVDAMVATGKFSIIVVDSVASLVPKAEIEGEMGDANVGRHAKLMSQACRKLAPAINKMGTIVIFINQIRMNIGNVMPGANPEFTTGGKALKFYASVRIDIRRIAQIKKGDEVVGGRTKIKVVKNKVAPPFRQTVVDIMYGEGISKEGELLALGESKKILEKSGTSYHYKEMILGRGYDASRIFLKENPDIAEQLKYDIMEAIKFEQSIAPEAEVEDNSTVTEE